MSIVCRGASQFQTNSVSRGRLEYGAMSPGVSVSGDCRNIHEHSQVVDMERWHSDSPDVDRVQ